MRLKYKLCRCKCKYRWKINSLMRQETGSHPLYPPWASGPPDHFALLLLAPIRFPYPFGLFLLLNSDLCLPEIAFALPRDCRPPRTRFQNCIWSASAARLQSFKYYPRPNRAYSNCFPNSEQGKGNAGAAAEVVPFLPHPSPLFSHPALDNFTSSALNLHLLSQF